MLPALQASYILLPIISTPTQQHLYTLFIHSIYTHNHIYIHN